MAMQITNKKFYTVDMDKDGEIFAEADGRRGNFRGHVVGSVNKEDIKGIAVGTIYTTTYQVHGETHRMTNKDGRAVDLATGKKTDITTRENIDHMLKTSLNCAYDYYKKHLRERRK